MNFGGRALTRGDRGPDVVELQLRLAGFRGTVWDGSYGPGTELQVIAFQRDYMQQANPSGTADRATVEALAQFAREYPVDFNLLRCPCQRCTGFGNARFKGEYRPGMPPQEAYHLYEYPGIHKAILHTYRAARFYAQHLVGLPLEFTSGYRCAEDNLMHRRSSTNHHGKALDCDFPWQAGELKSDDMRRCSWARGVLVEKCGFQLGWRAMNLKALEPDDVAPTWIHMDVRNYEARFLAEEYFVTSGEQLDQADLEETVTVAAPHSGDNPLGEVADILNRFN